jgi:hypothetical protein
MVTNSFGNRNFMQPMGRPKHALALFLLSFFGGVGEEGGGFFFIFPWFSMYSHYVPFKFTLGSQCVLHSTSFYPICFGKYCPPFTNIDGQKGRNSIFYTSK